MDLGALGRVVVPDHFLLRRNLFDKTHARIQDVPVAQHPDVVDLTAAAAGVGPNDLAVLDEEQRVVALAGVEHRMLSQAVARQIWRDRRWIGGWIPPAARRWSRLGGTKRRDIGRSELIEHLQQRRVLPDGTG